MKTLLLVLAQITASSQIVIDPPPPLPPLGQGLCQQHWVQVCGEHGCHPVLVCE